MACCVAVGCSNRSDRKDLSFYRFPKDPERRTLWVEAVSRLNWSPTDYSRICSKHFISGVVSSPVPPLSCFPNSSALLSRRGASTSHFIPPGRNHTTYTRVSIY
ncbi:hypothetical protein CHARACLAT_019373 [Characodon lateralis]|uniref:THAP-type domain-containing protein n=1 Tax=Characodon lateralis TaxID=208331 RepID=A0ABU7DSF8_9TELE|nr:hypothetical protein [Characodon lateralis]